SAESAIRVEDVLGLRSDALLVRLTNFGTERTGGGAYERPLLALYVFGPDGLVTRVEFFHPDHDREALARFDELGLTGADGPPSAQQAPSIENAATRLMHQFAAAWAARDWERVAAIFAPGFRMIDRRSYAHLDLDRDQNLESLRFRFEMRSSRYTCEV